MKFFNLKTGLFLSLCLLTVCMMSSCVGTGARTLIMTAPKTPLKIKATPPITANTAAEWESQKTQIFHTLEREVYGALPKTRSAQIKASRTLDSEDLNVTAEELTLTSSYAINQDLNVDNLEANNTVRQEREVEFTVVLITPENIEGPLPVIIMGNFCPNHNVIPLKGISKPTEGTFSCDGGGFMSKVFGYFFGRYIRTPPIQTIIDKGYALAVVFPSDVFPDRSSRLDVYKTAPDSRYRWGAIGAWAWQTSLISNVLDQDERFSHTIAYGHSRYGKAALLAAAYDDSIDAVIAHQSGTGGASLSRDKPGETVASITAQYPHWFTPAYDEDNITIDQHHLLAVVAPRPILIGNAKRDVWSDPEGAFRAARDATPIYKLYNSNGLDQDKLNQFNPEADLSFWIRPGTHGIVKEDWPAFLAFLDSHF